MLLAKPPDNFQPINVIIGLANQSLGAWNHLKQGEDWVTLSGSECSGMRQAPIDILREEVVPYDGNDVLKFSTSYCTEISGTISNNGHTLQFDTATGGPEAANYITGGPLGLSKYYFLQFHLHWGCDDSWGSEHLVDGQRYKTTKIVSDTFHFISKFISEYFSKR